MYTLENIFKPKFVPSKTTTTRDFDKTHVVKRTTLSAGNRQQATGSRQQATKQAADNKIRQQATTLLVYSPDLT